MSRTVPTDVGLNTNLTWERTLTDGVPTAFPTITIGMDFTWTAHHAVTPDTKQVDGRVTIPSCGHEFPLDLWFRDPDVDDDDMAIATLMWNKGNVYHAHTYIGLIVPFTSWGNGSSAQIALSRHLPNLTKSKD